MSNNAWRIVQALFLAAIVVWAVSIRDYWLIGLVLSIAAGNFVAIRLGNLGLATLPFWALTVGVVVSCFGLASLPFMPRIIGSFLIAGGIFSAFMMPLYHYGERLPGGSG